MSRSWKLFFNISTDSAGFHDVITTDGTSTISEEWQTALNYAMKT
jgi:hypothetical protein